jgi:biopolymer transport protein ExbD
VAFSLNNGGGGRGRRGFRGINGGALAEINIIPLVDVVLVLLIIFMLTAHVMEFGMEVEVPKVKHVKDTAEVLPVVNIAQDGGLFLIDKPVTLPDLITELKTKFPNAKAAYVRADKDTPWEVVAQVFNSFMGSGIDIRAVTQPEEVMAGKRK